jgi:hypothetical protein
LRQTTERRWWRLLGNAFSVASQWRDINFVQYNCN